MGGKKKVLIAPLNWGLGHATRCIPIIEDYLAKDWEVILASDGAALSLLRKTFPDLESHELPGYNIKYAKDARLINAVLLQLPKIWLRIRDEFLWLKAFTQLEDLDLIISDNRYGIHSKKIHSVIISHQLNIKSPVFEDMLNRYNHKMLNRFDECWVPDIEGLGNLSGELSNIPLDIPKKFIGHLSNLKKAKSDSEDIPLLCILSGPEPQRSILERELKPILIDYPGAFLIRGLVNEESMDDEEGLHVRGFADRKQVQELMNRSQLVICRAGYSSLMDLVQMDKKAILIPTPGQTEQEYLAKLHGSSLQFRSIDQEDISLGLRSLITTSTRWGLS
jgi:uncharacterized protein (TIGR00661 family)